MKSYIIAVVLLFTTPMLQAQTSTDNLFNRYSGKSGFTSISVSPGIFKLIAALDKNDPDLQMLSDKFSGLKILVSEKNDAGFSAEVKELIKKENLQVLMEIVEANKKVNFYASLNNGIISNMILHAIEPNEEVLLTISGNFSLKELSKMGNVSVLGNESKHIALLRELEE